MTLFQRLTFIAVPTLVFGISTAALLTTGGGLDDVAVIVALSVVLVGATTVLPAFVATRVRRRRRSPLDQRGTVALAEQRLAVTLAEQRLLLHHRYAVRFGWSEGGSAERFVGAASVHISALLSAIVAGRVTLDDLPDQYVFRTREGVFGLVVDDETIREIVG